MSSPRNLIIQEAEETHHSKEYLNDILAYYDKLYNQGLPVIYSIHHLCLLMGDLDKKVPKIITSRNSNYATFKIKKRSGGKREISAPFVPLRNIQQWIYQNILSKVPIHPSAYGFVKHKSIMDNAKVHVNQDFILNIDLLDFFTSIPEKRVYGIFKSLGYHPNLAVYLAKACTKNLVKEIDIEVLDWLNQAPFHQNNSVLPQGAPTSPQLSNLVCRRLDKRLNNYAVKNGCKYSRYADDITFSGSEVNNIKLGVIFRIINDEQFNVNLDKVKFFHKSSNRKIITGLIVSDKIRIPKKFKREIARHLHFTTMNGTQNHIQHLRQYHNFDKVNYRDWLYGKICYIKMIEPDFGLKLMTKFKSIDWGI
ncbi:reverse transcriptase family protein [Chitinophaga filiformis]|uniref:RNA-directed DNA polymerase n=1 Tax=Chitinophaga filiformis TaxID=104663 RepID=A0A1G8EAA2_CHIFI|nr:reverse transcriptase family protein [Chitinophaga filiformis]SDH66826.1 Reverse transcriptase (RNA-dependent DNA polymerase) [Chitinophaga filiformis]